MISRKTRGIVLSVSAYGESDKLVTFYSPDLGRSTGIAKGAKRSKQRFVNKLEEFSLLHIMYRPSRGSGLLFLSEAELDRAFLSLRRDYLRYVAAMFMSELVLRFTPEHDAEPELFSLLHWALASLDAGTSPRQVAALFHLRLLGATGYRPELNGCGICNSPVSVKRSFVLHPGSGGLICNRCRQKDPVSQPGLSIQTLKFLQNAQWLDLQRLHRLQLPARTTDETLKALYHYTRHLLQQDIHSWKFIRP